MHDLALDPASDSTPATDLSRALAFDRHRRRLTALAHRMLGSRAEAEDLVQDAWLRWHSAAPHADMRSEEAWLVTVVTRMAIDRLRVLRTERTHYPGFWLPEPMVEPLAASPEDALERAHDVSSALMLVLERLGPRGARRLLAARGVRCRPRRRGHSLGQDRGRLPPDGAPCPRAGAGRASALRAGWNRCSRSSATARRCSRSTPCATPTSWRASR